MPGHQCAPSIPAEAAQGLIPSQEEFWAGKQQAQLEHGYQTERGETNGLCMK